MLVCAESGDGVFGVAFGVCFIAIADGDKPGLDVGILPWRNISGGDCKWWGMWSGTWAG